MIRGFFGENRFMSNFYVCEDGYCVETEYQAAKFENDEIKGKILRMTPGKAKMFAKRNPDLVRKNWKSVNVLVMNNLIREKFKNDPERSMLENTGNHILVEDNNWHDNFWGHCHCSKCRKEPKHNVLGKILMEIRQENRGD